MGTKRVQGQRDDVSSSSEVADLQRFSLRVRRLTPSGRLWFFFTDGVFMVGDADPHS